MTIDPGGIATSEGLGAPRPKGTIRSWKPWTWRTIRGQLVGPGNIPTGESFGTPELQSIVRQILAAGNISSLQAVGTPIIHASIEIWAASPALADVQAAIALASTGDVVRIPAGSATWTAQLVITKGIYLIGSGIGVTIIYSATGGGLSQRMIHYQPSSPGLNEPFRISSMTLDGQSANGILLITNISTTYRLTKIRIDNIDFPHEAGYFMEIEGHVYGCMDHCTFSGSPHIDFYGLNSAWDNFSFEFGSPNQFYVEDCSWPGQGNTINSCGIGGRVCFRHNSIITTAGLSPIHDIHGNQPAGNSAGMGFECYENDYYLVGNASKLADLRGGKSLVYNNRLVFVTAAPYITFREEYIDSLGVGSAVNAISGQPQHVSDSYTWNNLKNGLLISPTITATQDYGGSIGLVPQFNVDCWKEIVPFDGSVGVGRGLLSARPSSGLIVGVGYWATDENKLYRAIGPSTWELFYQPYTYPHPLAI
jgi:hypothetical protein